MLDGLRFLAVVPARSGSKGIVDKNMRKLAGVSLIGHAARCLSSLPWLDRRIISTDSKAYAEEARAHGLDAPFLRPDDLSADASNVIDAIRQALTACESADGVTYDRVLIVEPTSPLRQPVDIERAARELTGERSSESVMCVSPAGTHCHPFKMLRMDDGYLDYYDPAAAAIVSRQQLDALYIRNGACYGMTREALFAHSSTLTRRTRAVLIDRPMANIDDPLDLEWAEFLLARAASISTGGRSCPK